MWLAEAGQPVKLVLVGFEKLGFGSIEKLKANPGAAGVSFDVAQDLLKLDPFVAGGTCAWLGNRFAYIPDLSFQTSGGAGFHASYVRQISWEDVQETTSFTTRTDETTRGLLSFLGIGPSETKTVVTKVSSSNSVGTTGSESVGATLDFPNINRPANIDVFYDRVFGTLVARTSCLSSPAVVLPGHNHQ